MQLFVQLNATDLPAEFDVGPREGMFQLFYCTEGHCDATAEGWEPFGGAKVTRFLESVSAEPARSAGPGKPHPARLITGWKSLEDYPHPAEFEVLGLDIDYDFKKKEARVRLKKEGFDHRTDHIEIAEEISQAREGDKLGGWPYWIQGVEYPSCPKCRNVMRLVFQIDSEENVPYMFGDSGVGHITQCAKHPAVVGFGWACC